MFHHKYDHGSEPGHPGPRERSHSFHLITLVKVMQTVRRHVVENTDRHTASRRNAMLRRRRGFGES